jgi:hypothetical protein
VTTDNLRPLRTGRRKTNIYYADTPRDDLTDEAGLGFIRDGELAVAMVQAYNDELEANRPRPAQPSTYVSAPCFRLHLGAGLSDDEAIEVARTFYREELDYATESLAAIERGEATVERTPATEATE